MKKLNKLVLIMIIITMLSNYLTIIGEIGSVVYASNDENVSSIELTMDSENLVDESQVNIEEENPYTREMLGDCLDLKSVLDNGERYKGILLANKFLDDEHRNEFEFQNTLELNIKKHAEIDSIVIDEGEFVVSDGRKLDFSSYTEYKRISITEEMFKDLFSDNGYIKFLDDKNEEVARIDSKLVSINGVYSLDFVKGISHLRFVIYGLKKDGKLTLEIEKNVLKEIPFSREEIELFEEMIIAEKATISRKNSKLNETIEEVKSENILPETSTDSTDVESKVEENSIDGLTPGIVDEEKTEEVVQNEKSLTLSTEDEKKVDNTEKVEDNNSITLDLDDSEKYFNFIDVVNAEKKELNSEEALVLDMAEEADVDKVEEIADDEILEIENEIILKKTETKVVVEMSTYEFDTSKETDVSFNVKMMSNSEKYDLFKDPYVEIIFPAEIEKVDIGSVNVLYKNGIDIDHYVVTKNEIGQNVLKLTLNGIQDSYATGLIDGITINFDATIGFGKMVANKKSNIMYRYSNEYANHIIYQENGLDSESVEIEFVGENKILKSTIVTDLDTNQVLLDSYNEDRSIESLANKSGLRLNVQTTMINNYGSDITDVIISGKTSNSENFESAQDVKLINNSVIDGAVLCDKESSTIYYSDEENTELDSAKWTTDISTLSGVKEFKVVLDKEEAMHQGDKIIVSYNVKLENEISYNELIAYENVINYTIGDIESKDTTIFGFETEIKSASIEDLLTYSLIKTDVEDPNSEVVIDIVNEENNISEIEEPKEDMVVPSISDAIKQEDEKEEDKDNIIEENIIESDDLVDETIQIPASDVENEVNVKDETDSKVDMVNEDSNMSDVLKVGTQVLIRNSEITDSDINERQMAKVRVILKNISDKALTNVKIEGKANNANIYYFNTFEMESDTSYEMITTGRYEEDTEGKHLVETDIVPSIAPGEEYVFEYEMVVKALVDLSQEDKAFYGIVSIEADGMKKAEINTEKYEVKDADIELRVMTGNYEDVENMGITSGSQFVYYTGGFKNISSKKMENIKLHFILPENMHMSPLNAYDEDEVIKEYTSVNGSIVEIIVPELEPGMAYTTILTVYVDKLPIDVREIYSTVGLSVIANGVEYKGNEVTRKVYQVESEFDTKLECDSDAKTLQDGDIVNYTYTVENVGCISQDKSFDMLLSSAVCPTEVNIYREDGTVESIGEEGFMIDSASNSIDFKYKIDPNEMVKIVVTAVYNAEDISSDNNKVQAEIFSDGEESINSMVDPTIIEVNSERFLEIVDNADETDISSKEMEEKTYYTEYYDENDEENVESEVIENEETGDITGDEETIEEVVEEPEEVSTEMHEEEISIENNSINNTTERNDYIVVYVDDEVTVKDYTQGRIVNRNIPLARIEENQNQQGNKIEGCVWIDTEEEGYLDGQDKQLEGIIVKLFNSNTNAIVKAAYTDERGRYEFDNLEDGRYAVLFSYDSDRYEFAKNRAIDETDLIASNINQTKTIDNEKYAISDTISIYDGKKITISLGLKEKDKYDLAIDGYISRIALGDNVYQLEESQEALEISGNENKKDAKVEYKITIKNNGNIDGTVGNISLSLPEGCTFAEESNPNWSVVGDRIVYTGSPLYVPAETENSIIVNVGGNVNNSLKSELKIEKTNPAKNVADSDSENDKSIILLEIHRNVDGLKVIIFSIVITIIFAVVLVACKNKIGIKALATIYILALTLNVFGNTVIGWDFNNLKANGWYWTDKNDRGTVEEINNHIQNWAIGWNAVNNDDVEHTGNHDGAEAHYRISEYMNNFYGAGTRYYLMQERNLKFVRDFSKARCNYCMQGSNVSYAGSSNTNHSGYRIIGIVDIGFDNGNAEYDYINRLNGTRNGRLYSGGSSSSSYVSTKDQAQTMAALAWNADTNQYNVKNLAQSKARYFYGLRYLLNSHGFSDGNSNSYNTNLNTAMGLSISNTVDAIGYHDDLVNGQRPNYGPYMTYIDNYQTAFRSAYNTNVSVYNISSINEYKKSTIKAQIATPSNNAAIEDEKYYDYTKKGKTGKAYFVGPIKVKLPAGTAASPINNKTVVKINGIQYKGDVYVEDGTDKVKFKFNCSSTDLSNNINNMNIYLPQNSIFKFAGKDSEEYNITFENSYDYYQARLIYFYQIKFKEYDASYCVQNDTAGQNKAVMRGRKRTRNSSATVKWKPSTTVKISKKITEVNGNSVNSSGNIYVENGDKIKYEVTLECLTGKTTQIVFKDLFDNGKSDNYFTLESKRANHDNNKLTNSGNVFTYNSTLKKGESVVISLTYKVEDDIHNKRDSNRKIENKVNITKVVANVFKKEKSKLTAKAECYMKMYQVNVDKYVTKVVHGEATPYERNGKGETNKFTSPVSVEIGDRVEYDIKVSNTGTANKYGSIKITDIVNTYDKGNFKLKSTEVSQYNSAKETDKIYENPVDEMLANGTRTTGVNLGSAIDLNENSMIFDSIKDNTLGSRIDGSLLVTYTDGVLDEDIFENQYYYYVPIEDTITDPETGETTTTIINMPTPTFTNIDPVTGVTTTSTDPERVGFTFLGWEEVDVEGEEEGDKVFKAKWQRKENYKKITYTDGIDSVVAFENQIYYYEPIMVTETDPDTNITTTTISNIPSPIFGYYTDPETDEELPVTTPPTITIKPDGVHEKKYSFVNWEIINDVEDGDKIYKAKWEEVVSASTVARKVSYTDGVEDAVVFADIVYTEKTAADIATLEHELGRSLSTQERALQDGDHTPVPEIPESYTTADGDTYVFVGWEPTIKEYVEPEYIYGTTSSEGYGDRFIDYIYGDVENPENVSGESTGNIIGIIVNPKYTAIWQNEEDINEDENEVPEPEPDAPEVVPATDDGEGASDEEYSLVFEDNTATSDVTIAYENRHDNNENEEDINVWKKGNASTDIMDKANHNNERMKKKTNPNGTVSNNSSDENENTLSPEVVLAPGESVIYHYTYYVDFNKNVPTNQIMNLTRIKRISMGNGLSNKVLYYSKNYTQSSNERNLMTKKAEGITGSNFRTADYIKAKRYSVVINKSVCSITDASGNNKVNYNRSGLSDEQKENRDIYADPGDIVTYKISVKNNGTSSDGDIKDVIFRDRFIETFVYKDDEGHDKEGFDYTSMQFKEAFAGNGATEDSTADGLAITANGTTTTKNGATSWTKSGNYYTCTSTIKPGKTKYIYLRYKVKKHTKLIEKVLNAASIVSVKNSNSKIIFRIKGGTDPIYRIGVYDSTILSSDYYTIRRYKVNVIKDVYSIDGVVVSSQNQLTCEVGDIVEYDVTITNAGTANAYGKIQKINIKDIFNETEAPGRLEYIKAEPPYGWTVKNQNSSEVITLEKADCGLDPGESIKFRVKMRVIYRDTTIGRQIVNTARIDKTDRTTPVTNRNNEDIRDVLLGKLEDNASMEYLTYRIDLRKYIVGQGKVNGKNRVDLTNKEKYDNPVEYENSEYGTYVIRIENTGRTKLKGAVINDILDQGLTFYKAKTNEAIKKIELSKDGMTKVIGGTITKSVDETNRLEAAVSADEIILPGAVLSIYVDFRVDKQNLYLWNLENTIDVIGVVNKHNIAIILPESDILALDRKDNKEYVRIKDVPINGYTWNDVNKNGVMETGEPKIQGVTVRLIDRTNNKYIETQTDADGKYTFPEGNGFNYLDGSVSSEKMVLPGGRVVRATNRNQTTGNYYLPRKVVPTPYTDKYAIYKTEAEKTLESSYIDYIIEFEYNGARFMSTNNYAGDSHINQTNFAMQEEYHVDSNAKEYGSMRQNFEKRLETINYNNAVSTADTGSVSERLYYDKEGHVSTLSNDLSNDKNDALRMQAYSFVTKPNENVTRLSDIWAGNDNSDSGNIKYLWLNKKNGATDTYCYEGETGYLKEINLGLKVQEFDLTLEKDLYSIRTTVNGEEADYKYNQGNNGAKNATYIGPYATGGKVVGGSFETTNYKFRFYSSDYNYRASQYKNAEVRTYKDGTELDTEVTYMITIRNDKTSIADDREHLYAVVNEITDFYPAAYVKYNPTDNTKVEKLFGRGNTSLDDTLTPRNVEITKAWYLNDSGQEVPLTLSNTSAHPITYGGVEATNYALANQNKSFGGYNKLYITGLGGIVLDWNESKNIFIKYTVDRDNAAPNNLKIDSGRTVAEINSYSTYENRTKTNAAGYVDINSNPGNVGYNSSENKFDSLFNYSEYENDTYKTGVTMDVVNPDPGTPFNPDDPEDPNNPPPDTTTLNNSERMITGIVWDDARTEAVGTASANTQYIGDGLYDGDLATHKTKNNKARKNPIFDENSDGDLYVQVDLLNGLTSEYFNTNLEEKDSPVQGVKVRLVELITVGDNIYEETINTSSSSQLVTTTNANGIFTLQGFIPGQYVVRYEYGYKTNNANLKANVLVYNGQDYKSAVYNEELDKVEITNTTNVNSVAGDAVLKALTGKDRAFGNNTIENGNRVSDARDDAIRRLKVNGYSEYVNNQKSNALQSSKKNTDTTIDATALNDMKNELLTNTSMYADTPTFPVRIEDDNYRKEVVYEFNEHQNIMYTVARYSLENVDFGVEYRPEADIDLSTYITEIKVKTASNKVLYDIKYDVLKENGGGRITGTKINKSTSVGLPNAQILPSDIYSGIKGFVYLNVDADTMQGTEVEISYVLNVNNISENDRIGKALRDILYEDDGNAFNATYATNGKEKVLNGTGNIVTQYRSTITASNALDAAFNVESRNNGATVGASGRIESSGNSIVRKKDVVRTSNGYYGLYLGNTYYTGSPSGRNTVKADGVTTLNYASETDVVSMMKINELLNYVDNDMVFDTSKNKTEDNYWRATTSEELYDRGYVSNGNFKAKDNTTDIGPWSGLLRDMITLLDNKGRRYDSDLNNTRLALVVNDAGANEVNASTLNKDINKFLETEKLNKDNSSASIALHTSKTINSEDDTKNMSYDNVAEVVEYRSETGRVTTLNSHSIKSTNGAEGNGVNKNDFSHFRSRWITIGNANLGSMMDTSFGDDGSRTDEPDTSMTETVTLTPPTGRYKLNYYLKTHRDLLKIVQITIALMICVPVAAIIVKKAKNYKKVYK